MSHAADILNKGAAHMTTHYLRDADWHRLREELARPLMLTALPIDDFRDELVRLQRTGHLTIVAFSDKLVVTGRIIHTYPRWEIARSTEADCIASLGDAVH
jgi:hypothetical protein